MRYCCVFCPFINKLLDCLSKQQYIALIAAINIICVILPTVLVWERDLITTGMDYEWLIPLYIIGGYIRKFGIPCGKNKALVGYVLCSLITGLVRVPLGLVSNRYSRQLCLIRDCFSVQFYYGCNGVSLLVLVPFKSQYWK